MTEQILDTSIRVCPVCQRECKGPLALHSHKKWYHASADAPLFRGKYPIRAPLGSELLTALENSISIADASRAIGLSYPTFRKWCELLIPLEYEEFKKNSHPYSKPKTHLRYNYPYYKKLVRILNGEIEKPKRWTKTKFVTLITRDALIEDKCSLCNFEERRITDYRIPLLMDVLNGNPLDWSRDNIRLLCYNCFFLNVRDFRGTEYSAFNKKSD